MPEKNLYGQYCKPKLAELLAALKLDIEYTAASGNYLHAKNRKVLDFISGFGASLLGHNHPELVNCAVQSLQQNIPFNAQGSMRNEAALLAERLNQLTPKDQDYYVNFSNSGAESIEAAIKHAYKVQFDKVRREYERISRVLNDFYYQVETKHLELDLPGKNDNITDFRDDLDEYNLAQFEAFQNNPVMIAFKGSFHGKSTSALKVTFNKSYREGFEGLSAIRTVYIDPNSPQRLPEIVNEHVSTFYYPVLNGNTVTLRPIVISQVIGLILELVLGEGGIHPVANSTLQYLADHHAKLHIPYIIDEIQTGCGRLGSIFSYTKTPLAKIQPEYITLSKALGGGLAKIGATLIAKPIYDHDFGILHTSTFGEDEFSSRIALRFLDLLTQNDDELLHQVEQKSNYLMQRLQQLQQCYPNIIKDVRGKGLMIGVELTPLEERSPFFRASGKQGVLSLLISSYLLHYHDIRVLAPLTTMLKGNPGKQRLSIIRIQPPLTISNQEIDRLYNALKEVFEIIDCNNEFCLIGHLANTPVTKTMRQSPTRLPAFWPITTETSHIDARTGFVVHPTRLKNLLEYYFPSFSHYKFDKNGLFDWWNSVSRFLEPVHVRSSYISSNDFVLENNMVFVPYLPEYITTNKTPYLQQEMRDKVQDAVTIAKELGDDNIPVSMVGLGAYTSIVTQNGQSINDYEMSITTGNAYTTALTLMGIMQAAEQRGLDLSKACIGVVGASGNIGMVIAQILSLNAGQLKLIGRDGKDSLFRLRIVHQQCLLEILKAIHKEIQHDGFIKETQLTGVGNNIYQLLKSNSGGKFNGILKQMEQQGVSEQVAVELEKTLTKTQSHHYQNNVQLHLELESLKDCDVIISATNSPDPDLIKPDKVKPGAIICCASVPSNISEKFEQHLDRFVAFDGGLAQLPEKSKVDFVGMPGGQLAFGCLAETFLLGFDGQNHSFCKGRLSSEQVYQTIELAHTHGFTLGKLKLNQIMLDNYSANSKVA